MRMIPCKFGILPLPAGESELRPHPDRLLASNLHIAVLRRVRHRGHFFRLIPAHAVIEHDVRIYLDTGLMKGLDRVQVFLLCSVLRADGSFLVEFSQIVHIVDAVPHVLLRGALVGRRQPHRCDSEIMQLACLGSAALPPEAVVRQIPLEKLHHCFICFHSLFSLSHSIIHGVWFNDRYTSTVFQKPVSNLACALYQRAS